MDYPMPTVEEINRARGLFEKNEPRGLFYRAATELVELALRGTSSLNIAEALAVLLLTWNRRFYNKNRPFNEEHMSAIEGLLNSHSRFLLPFRQRCIESLSEKDEKFVESIFRHFEDVLGPVGAAKSLHLLAPRFFPLWDNAIAKAYHLYLGIPGRKAKNYCRFMWIAKEQCIRLGGERSIGRNPLKALDEYNYCRYTKGWM